MWKRFFAPDGEEGEQFLEEPKEQEESQEPEGEEGAPKGDGDKVDVIALREEMVGMKEQMSRQQMQFVQEMGNLMREVKQPVAPPPDPEKGENLWELAKQMPEIMPDLIKKEIRDALKNTTGELRNDVLGEIDRRTSAKSLRESIMGIYGDELKDPDSEIVASTHAEKERIAPFLDPKFRGTDIHDQMAFLAAAAKNPRAVAKREVARAKAEQETRDARATRASMGSGGGRSTQGAAPAITAEHLAIGERLGIDLKDPKKRKEFLEAQGTETLEIFGSVEGGES